MNRQLPTHNSSSAATPNPADTLEQMLRMQLQCQQQMLECMQRKRQAIRTANLNLLTAICHEENSVLQRLAMLEQQRCELINKWSRVLAPQASGPLRFDEIAEKVADPQRTRLQALAAQLRETLQQTQHESSIIRTAAEALSRHMSGIAQTVRSALSRAQIYGLRGSVITGAPLHAALDIQS